jgi:hypothetical protein
MKQGLGTVQKTTSVCAKCEGRTVNLCHKAGVRNNKGLIASLISRKTLSVFLGRLERSSDTRIMYFEADIVFIYLNARDVSISTYC